MGYNRQVTDDTGPYATFCLISARSRLAGALSATSSATSTPDTPEALAGVADVENYLQLMKAFFGRFAELEGKCNFGLDFGAVRLASMSVCQPSVKAPAA